MAGEQHNVQRRVTARALLLDDKDRIYLMRLHLYFVEGEPSAWTAPGGGVEPGEVLTETLRRELWEELGVREADVEIGPEVWTVQRPLVRRDTHETFFWEEHYFPVRYRGGEFSWDGMTEFERRITLEGRWWTREELDATGDNLFLRDLGGHLEQLRAGLPATPLALEPSPWTTTG